MELTLPFSFFWKVADEPDKTEEEAAAGEEEGIKCTSDQCIISPYNTNTLSNRLVKRIEKSVSRDCFLDAPPT